MKILVTGCAGFIGSHITDALLANGHEVLGVDSFTNGHERNLSGCLEGTGNFKLLRRDICSLKAKDLEGVDSICHQAAIGSVPRSISKPVDTFETNVVGFQTLLEAARDVGIKRVVFASSSSTHGDRGKMLSPYAVSKKANELYAEQYAKHYGLEMIGLRYFNVYGPRQRADSAYAAVIPRWITAIQEGQPITIYGDGKQMRDFTYVKDVVRANMMALFGTNPGAHGKTFDIGTGRAEYLNALASCLMRQLKISVKINYEDARAGDISFSNAEVTQACDGIGFRSAYTLQSGLTNWFTQARSS